MVFIENDLNIPVNVFIQIDDKPKRPAVSNIAGRTSKLPAGEKLEYTPFRNDDSIKEGFKIIFEMEKEPEQNGIKGVKLVLAGTKLAGRSSLLEDLKIPHHFSYVEKEGKFYVIVHYMIDSDHSKSIDDKEVQEAIKDLLIHVDPTVKHPDDG